MVSSMGPNVYMWSLRCSANFDVLLLFLKDLKCSLYLLEKFPPVWPMYAVTQSIYVNLHTPLAKYLLEI
jgi:hypothetical protein